VTANGTGSRGKVIRVLIADDHPVVRQGLRTFLGIQDDIEVVGEAEDGVSAVTLAESLEPDIVLMDLKMPGADGLVALTELRARGVAARVLVLTSVTERGHVLPAVQAGAAGYLYKDVDPQALVQAIRAVNDGHVLFAPDAAEAMLADGPASQDDRGMAALTEREREVLVHIARGRSNREIARAMCTSTSRSRSVSAARPRSSRSAPPPGPPASIASAASGANSTCPSRTARIACTSACGSTSLYRYPAAPACTAGSTCPRSVTLVRTSTRAATPRARSSVSAAKPSAPGILRSMSTISGSSDSASVTADTPSSASPTTSMSSWMPRKVRSPCRTTGWSSAIRTLIVPSRGAAPFPVTAAPPAGRSCPSPAGRRS
jgi:DNA-binding NarL/FixJ family response regulator